MQTEIPPMFLESLVLKQGAHGSPEEGMCVMEAVSFVAGERFSDVPACASPAISAFMRSWNDSLNETDRQFLKPFILKLVGSKTTQEAEVTRSRLAQDWYIREFAPTWLELAGLSDHAAILRGLNKIASEAEVGAALPALSAADSAADSAAYSAAYSAAEEALAPTVKRLQTSALSLLNRMLEVC